MTTPAAETKSIGLPANVPLSWFLLPIAIGSHLDRFIMRWQLRTIYRDSAIWTTLSWHENPAHLPGLCKNACQPRHRRQLPIPPGRYKKFPRPGTSRKHGNFSGLSLSWRKCAWLTLWKKRKEKKTIWMKSAVNKSFCCSGVKACFRQRVKTKAFTSYEKLVIKSIPIIIKISDFVLGWWLSVFDLGWY